MINQRERTDLGPNGHEKYFMKVKKQNAKSD
jgi:hypothetical protein